VPFKSGTRLIFDPANPSSCFDCHFSPGSARSTLPVRTYHSAPALPSTQSSLSTTSPCHDIMIPSLVSLAGRCGRGVRMWGAAWPTALHLPGLGEVSLLDGERGAIQPPGRQAQVSQNRLLLSASFGCLPVRTGSLPLPGLSGPNCVYKDRSLPRGGRGIIAKLILPRH